MLSNWIPPHNINRAPAHYSNSMLCCILIPTNVIDTGTLDQLFIWPRIINWGATVWGNNKRSLHCASFARPLFISSVWAIDSHWCLPISAWALKIKNDLWTLLDNQSNGTLMITDRHERDQMATIESFNHQSLPKNVWALLTRVPPR